MIFIFFSSILSVAGQALTIKLGEQAIALNEMFTISAVATNTRLTACSEFPEIPGFQKGHNSRSQVTNIVNGQQTYSESIQQSYIASKEGKFKIPPFSMSINGQVVKSSGGTVEVGKAIQRQRRNVFDPFADIWGGYGYGASPPPKEAEAPADAPDGAFLAVTTSKSEVYVGEGFKLTATFLKPFEERDKYAFDVSISEQVVALQKSLKPASSWEENTPITRLNEERVMINGKLYIGYKLYETTFFPFSSGDIKFPSVPLNMKKYTFTGRRSMFGPEVKESMKTFYSLPKGVKVKALPDHPLKDQVNVGVYELAEDMNANVFHTGNSFIYSFGIQGRGNISSISEPKMYPTDSLIIYTPPNSKQQVNKSNGVVYGTKRFEYFIEPLEPGAYQLANRFEWVYFDPEREVYDTLRSKKIIEVIGESKRDEKVAAADLGEYYNDIATTDNSLRSKDGGAWAKWTANASMLMVFTGIGLLMWKKKQK